MDITTAIAIASDVTNRIHPHDKRIEAVELLVLDILKTIKAGSKAPAAKQPSPKKGAKK